jgi:ribosome-associated toxin RatA of RatAB toxin-antitoxin module
MEGKMQRLIVNLFVLLSFQAVFSFACIAAEPVHVELTSIGELMDTNTLGPLLEKGELSMVTSREDGHLKQAIVIGLVKAPPEKVWGVVTDYEHYKDFMPNVKESKVLKREGDDVVVHYVIAVPGPNVHYTLRHHHVAPGRIDISLEDDKGSIRTGGWRWEFLPVDNGAKTIMVYYLYTDVRETSWIVRYILKSSPYIEHGINVSAGLVTLAGLRARIEHPEKAVVQSADFPDKPSSNE